MNRTSGFALLGWRSGPRTVATLVQGKKEHININTFGGMPRDWAGGKSLFMCFCRVVPYGGEKTHKQNPQKIPGQSREMFVYVFICLCVFRPQSQGVSHRVSPGPSGPQALECPNIDMCLDAPQRRKHPMRHSCGHPSFGWSHFRGHSFGQCHSDTEQAEGLLCRRFWQRWPLSRSPRS